MRLDPKAAAVDLSRAAKQWQTLGEGKIAAGRNPEDSNAKRRLSSFLDAVAPFRKAQTLWVETAKLMREVGSANERSATVADQQVKTCDRQIEFCAESFNEIVMKLAYQTEQPASPILSRIAAYEFERSADNRPFEWLIAQFRQDQVLNRRQNWGKDIDLWWLST